MINLLSLNIFSEVIHLSTVPSPALYAHIAKLKLPLYRSNSVLKYFVPTVIILAVLIVLSFTGFGSRGENRKQLRITIPENLNYMAVFDDIFAKYLSENELRKVKTTNMGTMFELTYECRMKDESEQKQFIDELRVRNGNLNITMGTMPNSDGGNLN